MMSMMKIINTNKAIAQFSSLRVPPQQIQPVEDHDDELGSPSEYGHVQA
jgi:hypothetical protein